MVFVDFKNVKLLVEDYFNGQYEVKKFLGAGSFAEVYLVKHVFLDDLRAMKIIKEPLGSTSNNKSVFSEVRLATQLRHENIISIYDAGIMSVGDGDFNLKKDDGIKTDRAYFIMEYVPGGDLQQYLNSFINSDLSMPINRVLDLMRQILKGLNTLHSANPPIVHRDLKLNNILISYDCNGEIVIKISDFGFAKEVTTGISDFEIAGTRPYMAPECFSKISTTMTDIYAVGVIFYQLLTNNYPYSVNEFSVEDVFDLKPWNSSLKPPSHINNNVFDLIDEIVMKSLDKNPKNRYAEASEMLEDVELAIDAFKASKKLEDTIKTDSVEDYSNYIINDSIKEAFKLAKCENRLSYAIEILEKEVLRDYDIRKCYGETLMLWKSQRPDVKLISKAFTVNLEGKNYQLSRSLIKEAIAYNPSLKNKYNYYIDLWEIFIELSATGNLSKAVSDLEELMKSNKYVHETYAKIINTLRTYSTEEIVAKAIRLVELNDLMDASNLMEFAVVCDVRIRKKYAYIMSLWKQNMKLHCKFDGLIKKDTIDYAIDLGTTDSVISYFNGGNPCIIKNYRTGDDFTPSAVLIDEDNNVLVGVDARDALIEDNLNAVSEFKHDMGFPVPFKFEKASRVMLPEELSAEILKELRISVFKQFGVQIEHAVICVPANSNPIKTKAVNDAAEIAGFRSHSLILEPIAVALAYGLKSTGENNGVWLIYDLGGGTFNLSLVKDRDGEIERVASIGLDNLGGNVFDWAVVNDVLASKIADDLNLDDFTRENAKYRKVFSKLKTASEMAKKELSKYASSDIVIDNLFDGYDFTYTLTQEEFKQIITPYIKTTFALVNILLDDNSYSLEDIDKIILVGGSCLSPIVKDLLAGEFGIGLDDSINPLTAVAKGAAIYAGTLEKPQIDFTSDDFSLIVTNRDWGYIGRVFSLDDKFSFLGYDIEFADVKKNSSSGKTPINIDGTFKIIMPPGEYEINIYNEDKPVKLDEKSPNMIKYEDIHIPYFNDNFTSFNDEITLDALTYKFVNLTKAIDYLNDYDHLREIDILGYVERLLEISRMDKNAFSQTLIYLDYLESIVDDAVNQLEFERLMANVENKLEIAESKSLFECDEFNNRFKSAENSDDLKEIYGDIVEKYVELNKDDVVVDVFFNLRYDGVYIDDKQLSQELINDGLVALNNEDYDELSSIVEKLCRIDERNI